MTTMVIVAVRDRAMDGFMRPFFVPTKGMAVRSFQDEINRKSSDNAMNAHPEDYDLYYMGLFDEESGKVDQKDAPKMLAIGKDMVKGNV